MGFYIVSKIEDPNIMGFYIVSKTEDPNIMGFYSVEHWRSKYGISYSVKYWRYKYYGILHRVEYWRSKYYGILHRVEYWRSKYYGILHRVDLKKRYRSFDASQCFHLQDQHSQKTWIIINRTVRHSNLTTCLFLRIFSIVLSSIKTTVPKNNIFPF